MRVVVAGATGALGHALIPKLVHAGHEVAGLSRAHRSREAVQLLGARHVRGDLLEREELTSALGAARPDVVIHAAKAIPKRGPIFFRDMALTNRLHDVGTRNLVQAAVDAGASKVIVESIIFAYGYGDFGDTVITEEHATGTQIPRRKLTDEVNAVLAMERHVQVAQERGLLTGLALRCGMFYGPRAGTDLMVRMLRRRAMPLPGGGGRWSVVYIDDVADACVAAVDTEATGAFNIVDDEPVLLRDFTHELARLAEVPAPWHLPRRAAMVVAPYFTEVAMTSMRVSNRKAKEVLRWAPKHPTFRDGLAAWLASTDE